MSQNFLLDASFHLALVEVDQLFAKEAQERGCECGGKLDIADYPRSPFGLPFILRAFYQNRFSFCCNLCRKRSTPESVRFFGRRRFPGALFLLVCLLKCGISERRLRQIKQHFGITLSESTWKRWRAWWRDTFEKTPFWRQSAGLLPPLDLKVKGSGVLPSILLSSFRGTFVEKLHKLLVFLAPQSSGVLRAI